MIAGGQAFAAIASEPSQEVVMPTHNPNDPHRTSSITAQAIGTASNRHNVTVTARGTM